MEASQRVAVVIPIYQAELSAGEELSLQQCMQVLGHYPIIVMKPASLNLGHLLKIWPTLRFQDFEDSYFTGIAGYNQLLTSVHFYRVFEHYEYILIHQLDAYIFKDELLEWCNLNLDYVGAPHLTLDHWRIRNKSLRSNIVEEQRVLLNGGFSLRRIKGCIRLLQWYNTVYGRWKGNEDMLFSLQATRIKYLKYVFRLPTWRQALGFAFEKHPAVCFAINGRQLPFGCHAWEKYDPKFWQPFIQRVSQQV